MLRSLTAALALTALTACAPASENPTPQRIGLANPASVYCTQQGGKLEIRNEAAGQVGYCHLPDGRIVEEWALYRAAHPAPSE
jgi:putative hemolysin